MVWWMAAMAAGQAATGGLQESTNAHNRQAEAYMNESDMLVQNVAENKAISEANLTNLIRNGYRQGLLNVQRAQAKRAAASQGIDVQREVLQALGAATANAAAAGAVGSSVDAVMQEIAVKQDQAQAQQSENYRVTVENFDTQLHDLIQAGLDSQVSSRKVQVRRSPNMGAAGYAEIALGSLLAGAQAAGFGSSPVKGA